MWIHKDSFLLRIWLMIASWVSLSVSLLYLCFFTLPHASWMPSVHDWQELAPKFLSQLHKDTDWQPDDGNFLLLVSITNMVGSIGYDRSSFYTMVSPYWATVLATSSIFSLFMVLASWVLLWYLICKYQLSLRYIPAPWIVLHSMLLLSLLVVLIILLGDMNSPTRLEMEHMLGKGNYARVITGLMMIILYVYTSILVAFIHIDNKMIEKERMDGLSRLFRLVDISISSSQAEDSQQHLPPGNSAPSRSELYPSLH